MKKIIVVCLTEQLCFVSTLFSKKQPVDYADPLLGTSESRWMLNPGATMPFGMVQLAPITRAVCGNRAMNIVLII